MEEWIGNGYVDIDPNSYNISPTALAAAITPGVKAIIVVHMHGISCDRDEIIGHARSRAFSSRTALRLMAHSTTGKHIGFCPISVAPACKELAPVRGRWRIHGDKQARCAVIQTTSRVHRDVIMLNTRSSGRVFLKLQSHRMEQGWT
ncbi:DegT/DnrJ/EryC1/StrS family aminotransferase [Sinorhizobium meliloti]|uniref:DegT/DnrJ/EryC1/StrS family aminotransferase n=1 Tax=Rhizobium meliloti TaxID=382 RepID=UPI001F2674C1|nr:DegT/DnrJ/EryC1/StrS family aminotransferase [Sinorhizobium meliloti]MDE4579788.1 DegT/DnrJ/EryC1/StrS family aminotransferase [Sinorhizobium meliloti]WGI77287.1 DegT/DnrJ/EryC1/StrS family aminotransferase [Sinorhizobium meliloti]